MLHKTRAIVIRTHKYSETSVIVKAYTELFGLQSYLVSGVRTQKAKMKGALFQPLVLLEMVVYHKDRVEALNRVSEIKTAYTFTTIPFEIKKTSIALFLSELLSKTLHEEPNEALFDFLYEGIVLLDEATQDYDNLNLQFLLGLLNFSGLLPESPNLIFEELYKTKMIKELPSTFQIAQKALQELQKTPFGSKIQISATLRRQLLQYLLDFCKLHWEFFGELKSLHILREVLRND